ncbi:MAG: FG-GAP-like repeat-containing protein [Prevotellaceae bacterium]|jgi:alpha-glucosidase|nr:FG-GAP-like repeat-containing protein [Prevotellaceae bacterium]
MKTRIAKQLALAAIILGCSSLMAQAAPTPSTFTQVKPLGEVSFENGAGTAWGDYNNDGHLDVFLWGYSGTSRPFLCQNDGSGGFTDVTEAAFPNPFEGFNKQLVYASAAWLDYDNDGNLDIIISGHWWGIGTYTKLFRNSGEPGYTLTETSIAFPGIDSRSNDNSTRFLAVSDYNNDGYPDIVITGMSAAGAFDAWHFVGDDYVLGRVDPAPVFYLYKNTAGTGFELQDKAVNGANFPRATGGSVAWGDYNNDGYPDILYTATGHDGWGDGYDRNIGIYTNNGDGTFTSDGGHTFDYGPQNGEAAWIDYDNDGCLDVFVTGYDWDPTYGYTGKLFHNNQNGTFTKITGHGITPTQFSSSIAVGDLNNDGFADVALIGNNGARGIYYNNGDGTFTKNTDVIADAWGNTYELTEGTVGFVDYDGDGALDISVIGRNTHFVLYKNTSNIATSPDAPTNLRTSMLGTVASLEWEAPAFSSPLRYNVYVKNVSTEAVQILAPADIATGHLKTGLDNVNLLTTTSFGARGLSAGAYEWGVQAISSSGAASAFAYGGQFIVTLISDHEVSSPNGKLKIKVTGLNSDVSYLVTLNGATLIGSSSIAMALSNGKRLGQNVSLNSITPVEVRNRNIPILYGKNATMSESYNEATIAFNENHSLVVRAYDEGVAYRWVMQYGAEEVFVTSEQADFTFTDNPKVYYPGTSSSMTQFENFYWEYSSINNIPTGDGTRSYKRCATPAMFARTDGVKVVVTESDVFQYPSLMLEKKNSTTVRGLWAFYPKTWNGQRPGEEYGDGYASHEVTERENYMAKTPGSRSCPWRVMIVSEQDKYLLNNELVFKLARPQVTDKGDFGFVKPGKSLWEWLHDGVLEAHAPQKVNGKLTYEVYKYYVDFAIDNKIEYVTLDAGWDAMDEGDDNHTNIKKLCAYAKAHGVKIIVWEHSYRLFEYNWVISDERNFGISGFKIDFIARNDQQANDWVEATARECAGWGMVLLIHGSPTPMGLNRTYPNILSYEAIPGEERYKWNDRDNEPKGEVGPDANFHTTFPFIRMLNGSVDYTPGSLNNVFKSNFNVITSGRPQSIGTRCHELSLLVVLDHYLTTLCDAPTEYEKSENAEIMRFMMKIPSTWDKTVPLSARVGEHIVMAKQKGDIWYVGGMTNNTARSLTVDDFSFLPDGVTFKGYLYKDVQGGAATAYTCEALSNITSATGSMEVACVKEGGFVMQLYIENSPDDPNFSIVHVPQPVDGTEELPKPYNASAAWGDYNSDGYLDLVLTGAGNGVFANNHSGRLTKLAGTPAALEYAGASFAWIDYNNDGVLDFLTSGKNGDENPALKLFTGIDGGGSVSYAETAVPAFAAIDYGGGNNPTRSIAVADYNNDGYADVLVMGLDAAANQRRVYLYKNLNGAGFEQATGVFGGADYLACNGGGIAWGDFNGDGYQDVLFSGYVDGADPRAGIYKNNGDGTFGPLTLTLHGGGALGTYGGEVAWLDYNNDGRLDALITGGGSFLFRNDGGETFTEVENTGIASMSESSVACGDVNGDGYADIVVSGTSGSDIYLNRGGSGAFSRVSGILPVSHAGVTTLADYDKNNLLDIFTTGYDASDLLKNKTAVSLAPPAQPTALEAVEESEAGTVTLSWVAPAGASLRYNLYLKSNATGAIYTVAPVDISSGFLKVGLDNVALLTGASHVIKGLNYGAYTWGVQAITNGRVAGEFAAASAFTVKHRGKAITSFAVGNRAANINEDEKIIVLTYNAGEAVDRANLTPTFTLSTGAKVYVENAEQASGVTVQDFTAPVTYRVVAENGEVESYTVTVVKNYYTGTDIISFAVDGGSVEIVGTGITLTYAAGVAVDRANLTPTFTLSAGAKVYVENAEQASGVTVQDFTDPVAYKVVAEDGTTEAIYTVTVVKNYYTEKMITSFAVGNDEATINEEGTKTITLTYPRLTVVNLKNLTPTFALSLGATAIVGETLQVSGSTVNDFSSTVQYVVTAEDGSSVIYNVTITVYKNPYKSITLFEVGTNSATISGDAKTITLTYGKGVMVNLANLVPTFAVSEGATVYVGVAEQESGITPQDFTNPVDYRVVAEDGTEATYTVTVVKEYYTGTAITDFTAGGKTAEIVGTNITLTFAAGEAVALTNLAPTFTLSEGAKVYVGDDEQKSGETAQDFTSSVPYRVVAEDKSKAAIYTVTVNKDYYTEYEITTFSIGSYTGVIEGMNVTVTYPAGTDRATLTGLQPSFTLSAGATATVSGVSQTSGVSTVGGFADGPVTYRVTAENGENSEYVVDIAIAKYTGHSIVQVWLGDNFGVPTGDNEIVITVPFDYSEDLSSVAIGFQLSPGATAVAGSQVQTSGESVQNFTVPVSYKVTAEDGMGTTTYTISIVKANRTGSRIITFTLSGVSGVIDQSEHLIKVTLPAGYTGDLSSLVAAFTLDGGATASVGETLQETGVTRNDFSNMVEVAYKVTAEDMVSTTTYNVTVEVAKYAGTQITALSFYGRAAGINHSSHAITVTYAEGEAVNLAGLVPTFTLSTGAKVYVGDAEQASGEDAQDFTSPVAYRVVAENGDVATYTVTVIKRYYTGKAITSFSVGNDAATITEGAKTIALTYPAGTTVDLENLAPTFTLSAGATATVGGTLQTSGESTNNFTGAVAYRVTAEDGTYADYSVAITVTKYTGKTIALFAIGGKSGVVNGDERTITITYAAGEAVNPIGLVPTFTLSTGAKVYVGEVEQASGVSAQDFTSPVAYKVVAEDGSEATYTVTVVKNYYTGKAITYFTAGSKVAEIVGTNITLTYAAGEAVTLTNLKPTFTLSPGAKVYVGDAEQTSGVSAQDFTTPVTYRVVAEDKSEAIYTVTVIKNYYTGKAITSFAAGSKVASISEDAKTITLTYAPGEAVNLASLVPAFTLSTGAKVYVGDVEQASTVNVQDFTSPVAYRVVADDKSEAIYTVTVVKNYYTGKAITSFRVGSDEAAISEDAKTITLTYPRGTAIDLENLTPAFTLSAGATATVGGALQVSGETANDFSSAVQYAVTAENGESATYSVAITVVKLSDKAIALFAVGDKSGAISESAKTITLTYAEGEAVNLASLVPTFALSTGAKVYVGDAEQASGVSAQDFTSPVAYRVVAEDGSEATYTVTVIKSYYIDKAITSFAAGGKTASINEAAKTITLTYAEGEPVGDRTSLVPTFTLSAGARVYVGDAEQTSGADAQDFTNPVRYRVVAEDGTEVTYTVTVVKLYYTATLIGSFRIGNDEAVVDREARTITLVYPAGANVDLKNLVATFVLSFGATATVNGAPQVSGVTANDFTGVVEYVVATEDGSSATYRVSITKETQSTGISGSSYDDAVKVYVAAGGTRLMVVCAAGSIHSLRIVSLQGSVLLSQKYDGLSNHEAVDITPLISGLYVVVVETSSGTYSSKFTKN